MSPFQYPWDVSRLSVLKNSRIFMTGGTGFFGKWILRFFVETYEDLGVEVTVLSRNPKRFINTSPEWGLARNVSLVQGDVRTFDFPAGEFDFVIHAAAPVGSETIPYDSPDMYSIIVDGTRRVLDFAEQAGAKRILHVSSGGGYTEFSRPLFHILAKPRRVSRAMPMAKGSCNPRICVWLVH